MTARLDQAHAEVLYFQGYRDSTRRLVRQAHRNHHRQPRVDSALYGKHLKWLAITAGADSVQLLTQQARRFLSTLRGKRSPEMGHFLEFLARGHPVDRRALRLFREALAIYSEREGPQSPRFAKVLNDYALRIDNSDPDSAAHMLARAHQIYRDAYGPDHPQTRGVFYNLAAMRFEQGQYERARSLLEQILARRRRSASGAMKLAYPLYYLGRTCRQMGDLKPAAAYLREAVDLLQTVTAPHNARVLLARSHLARTRIEQNRYRQAQKLLQRNYAERDQAREAIIERTRKGFVLLYTAWGKPERAAQYRAPDRPGSGA